MQDVALRAVSMADATEAMICTTHLMVSFLVIRVSFFLFWHGFDNLVTDSIILHGFDNFGTDSTD